MGWPGFKGGRCAADSSVASPESSGPGVSVADDVPVVVVVWGAVDVGRY
jgi:hypothetical protein